MRGKNHLLGPLEMLIYWQYEIDSHHGRHTQNQVLLSILSLNLCDSFAVIRCEAAVLAMWRESKELLISNEMAVNFFGDLTFSVSVSLPFSLCAFISISAGVSSCLWKDKKIKRATYYGRFRTEVVCYWWVNLRHLEKVFLGDSIHSRDSIITTLNILLLKTS